MMEDGRGNARRMGRAAGGQFVVPPDVMDGNIGPEAHHGSPVAVFDKVVPVGDATAQGTDGNIPVPERKRPYLLFRQGRHGWSPDYACFEEKLPRKAKRVKNNPHKSSQI